ncbi:hypothetical protein ACFQ1T_13530 [Methylophilus glucosoxydans]|uniref:Lipoprotein n=1 Tax=Methylophilus glucosoxydans TaxID=752553 RepID=A0ABW3GJK8_9PROT
MLARLFKAPRQSISSAITTAFLCTLLTACGSTPYVGQQSNMASQQNAQIKTFQSLVDKKEWQKAFDFYNQNASVLDNSAEGKATAEKLTLQIQKFWAEDVIDKLSNDLEAIAKNLNTNDTTQWPYIKTKLSKSNETLSDISNHSLVGKRNPFSTWPSAIRLKAAHDLITKSYITALQKSLEQSNIETDDFFNTYPLAISDEYKDEVSKEIFPSIQSRLSKSKNTEQASKLLKAYEPYLITPARSKLAATWLKQYAKEKKIKQPLTLQQRINALKAFSNNPEQWINSVVIAIKSSNQEINKHLPKAIGAQNSTTIEINEIDNTIKKFSPEDYDLISFVSVSPATGSSQIVKEEKQPAKYLVKEEKIANPELDSLRKKLDDEQASLSNIRQSNRNSAMLNSMNNTGDKDIAILQALTNGLAKYSESEAESDVNDARKALNAAPKTISKKVYGDYQRVKITRKHIAEMPVDILVYDAATKNYYAFNDEIKKEREFSYIDPQSLKQSDSDPPPSLLLAKMWEMLAEQLQQKDFKQYSLNQSQLVNLTTEKTKPTKLAQWIKQVEKNQTHTNEKLLTELAAAGKPWSAETDSPLELYKKIKQRFQ